MPTRLRTKGRITQTPVATSFNEKPIALIADDSGSLLAIDPSFETPDEDRIIQTWPLGGRPSAPPLVNPSRQHIINVLGEDGVVMCVPLPQSSESGWRFPQEGRLGTIIGQAAIGQNGIYVADDFGMLYCVDLNGEERWRLDLGSSPSTGVLAIDGRLYVGTKAAELLCIEEGE